MSQPHRPTGGRDRRRDAPRPTPRPQRSPRGLALDLLRRIEREGAYANLVLPAALASSGLEERDRGFVTDLVQGTTRMRRACDAVVDRFVLREPEPEVRTLLRLGAYQLMWGGVAAHAAVDETVSLAPQRARGFVNAILRQVLRTPMVWPDRASELSYPDWIVARLHAELGDDADAALVRMNEPPPVTVREDGYVQDRASSWVAAAVEARAGELVLDLCAAPGGKATALAAVGATVVAADVRPARAALLARNIAATTALRATDRGVAWAVAADGCRPPFRAGTFDRVLLDAPCSGLGALRRRADARWRITPTDLDELVVLQHDLLTRAAELVAPGGLLVSSVCTLTAAESIDHGVPDGFDVVAEPPPVGSWRPFGIGWRVLPQDDDTDGMVLVRYRRRDERSEPSTPG